MLETERVNKYTFFFLSELFLRIKTLKRSDLALPENHAEHCLDRSKSKPLKLYFSFSRIMTIFI